MLSSSSLLNPSKAIQSLSKLNIFLSCVFILTTISLAYFTPRENFFPLLAQFTILCLIYCYWVFYSNSTAQSGHLFLVLALGLRALLLFSLPNFTDDFYRFIWDGEVFSAGVSPFQLKPSDFTATERVSFGFTPEFFSKLNSPNFYTVYPPISQSIFFASAKLTSTFFSDTSLLNTLPFRVTVMKVFLLFFEIGSIFYLIQFQEHLKLQSNTVFIYALNPLVLLELVGNCHFEPAMIFFLLASVYNFIKERWMIAAILFACSVSAKLVSLILIPFFVYRLGFRRGVSFALISLSITGVLFIPFIDISFAENLGQSIGLFFQVLEFNAGIYLFFKGLLQAFEWYSVQMILGKIFGAISTILLTLIFFWYLARKAVPFLEAILLSFTVYFLFSVVLHPWYLTTLVAIASLFSIRYPIAWSLLAIVSYSAYSTFPYGEKPLVIIGEYWILLVFIWLERKSLSSLITSPINLTSQSNSP